jgi:glucose/arabinose dehydrogenase
MNSILRPTRVFFVLAFLCLLAGSARCSSPRRTAPSSHAPSKRPAGSAALEPGLRLRAYDIGEDMDRLYALKPDQTPNYEKVLPSIDLSDAASFGGLEQNFRAEVTATIRVVKPGMYSFRMTSDDGAKLSVDDRTVINDDGRHPADSPKRGTIELTEGDHALKVAYFQNGGGMRLKLEWKRPGEEKSTLLSGDDVLVDPGLTPVVSAGRKKLARDTALTRPGDAWPVEGVHPGWAVTTLHPPDFSPAVSALAFAHDGKLLVATFDPPDGKTPFPDPRVTGVIYKFDPNPPSDLATIKYTRVADQLIQPQGMCVQDGRLFVTQREEMTELLDKDGDGFYETHKTLVTGWKADNYHHFTFCLVPKDGYFFTALSTAIVLDKQGAELGMTDPVYGLLGPNPPHRGAVLRLDPNTGSVEDFAGGVRTPNGMGIGPDGELFVTDNQGAWLPGNKLIHVQQGHFYGHYLPKSVYKNMPEGGAPSPFEDQPVSPPAIWLPHGEVSNSPTQFVLIPDGPFKGQLYMGELTQGGVRRLFLEKVNGVYQGAAFQFTQGLEGGVNRVIWGPDGALYLGMMGRGPEGNWNWRGTTSGLQKLTPTGTTVFEMHSMSITPDGFLVRFTKPVPSAWLSDPKHYELFTYTYAPTHDYGGPKVDEHRLDVTSAEPGADGRSVRLVVPGVKRGYICYLRTDPISTDGEQIWSTESWYTVNEIPSKRD